MTFRRVRRKPSTPRLRCSILCLLLLTPALDAQEWPQWRGAGGLGVAEVPGLPERWGPDSDNLRWRTEIPGEGVSSPIVSEGRVFLTSAYEDPGRETLHQALGILTVALALALAGLAFARVVRLRRGSDPADGRAALFLVGGTVLFSLATVLVVIRPELFLEGGNPGRTWRSMSTLALFGLGVALVWLQPRSRGRLFGALMVLAVSSYLAYHIPSGPKGSVPLTKALGVVLPGLLAGSWGIWSYQKARRSGGSSKGLHDARLALPTVILATLVFAPLNFPSGLQRVVVCLDLETGELLWQRAVFAAPSEQKSPKASYATPTPAADGERVFAYFGSGIAALDYDGHIQWIQRFPEYSGHTRYGAATSPVLWGETVILLHERESFQNGPLSWMAAFDKASGERRWWVEPEGTLDSYGTPLLWSHPAGDQLVAASHEVLIGFDPHSGERLWSHAYPMQQIAASLARSGDLVAVTGGGHEPRALFVIRLPDLASYAVAQTIWQTKRGVAIVVSPVMYRGMLFSLTSAGVLTTYAAATGEELWKRRLEGEYFASLVAGDGKVYATNTEGATTVFAAAPEYQELSRNESADGVYASMAVADGGLLIRSATELFFFEGTGVEGTGSSTKLPTS